MKFKITPEDIGRIAVCSEGVYLECAHVGEASAGFLNPHGFYETHTRDGKSYIDGQHGLVRWKPETLRMPFKWWVIYKDKIKLGRSISRPDLTVSQRNYVAALIYARVPPEHVPIGTFHTQEDAERIRREEDA